MGQGTTDHGGTVVLRRAQEGCWRWFRRPLEVVATRDPAEVPGILRRLEQQVREGRHAAGFLSYEAAPGFDPALRVLRSSEFPVLWFGLYAGFEDTAELPPLAAAELPEEARDGDLDWQPEVTREEYERALLRVKERIRSGDTYQVNYTYRLRAPFAGDPWRYFQELAGRARAGHAAYVDLGRWAVCCASPELFFSLEAGTLVCRPMKGTAPRGGSPAEDERLERGLSQSAKDRSENIMIVDMIRNDMGRVADIGTVSVPRLCEIERYPTVLQMTSTVEARVSVPPGEVLAALFPCASITGAPKVSTMGIIADLESSPRGLYTGSIGELSPGAGGMTARFNVAIRTVVVDRRAASAEYGVGGGILWESDPAAEYRECEIKCRVLRPVPPAPPAASSRPPAASASPPAASARPPAASARPPAPRQVELLEALLWTPQEGFFLLERHLDRLRESARCFGMPLDADAALQALERVARGLPPASHKVRLVVRAGEEPQVSAQRLEEIARPPLQRVCLASAPVSRSDPLLCHKTTSRGRFQRELRDHPGFDDVILWNEEGEVTESCTANVVVQAPEGKVTPPAACGLLPGTFRAQLLEDGIVAERVVSREELRAAPAIWLVNSVRKWMPAVLLEPEDGSRRQAERRDGDTRR